MATRIQLRRGDASEWTSVDPVLSEGELGYETDTGKFKIGNGTDLWSALDYFGGEVDLSEYLTIASASTTYLAQSSAITPAYLPFVSGAFYKNPGSNGNGFVGSLNSTNFGHFYVGATTSFDRIGCTTGAFTTAGTARLGIYTDSGGKPGNLVLDAGVVNFSAGNTSYLITINQSLTPGWYWLAHNMQSGDTQWFGSGGNQTSVASVQRMGSTSVFTKQVSGYEQTSVTGAFPATATGAFITTNGIPSAYLRAT